MSGQRIRAELSGTMSADEIRSLLREQTQSTLNAVGAGLRVVDVSLLQDFKLPWYIQQTDDYSENLQLASWRSRTPARRPTRR